MKIETLSGLRGGDIYKAAGLPPTTARTWGLDLGTSSGQGHPRYGVADVVTLMLMLHLTTKQGVSARHARKIVKLLNLKMDDFIAKVAADYEQSDKWNVEGGPYALIFGRPIGPMIRPSDLLRIESGDDPTEALAELNERMSIEDDNTASQTLVKNGYRDGVLIVPLRQIITDAIQSLKSVMEAKKRDKS